MDGIFQKLGQRDDISACWYFGGVNNVPVKRIEFQIMGVLLYFILRISFQ